MFIRFVVGADDENAAWLTGVITAACILRDGGDLLDHEVDLVNGSFAWFNRHLPCPPFKEKFRTGAWTREAVCWFRSDARGPVGRVWDLVAVLREHDMPVRLVTSASPGKVVYEDPYQVVAETPYWA